MRARLQKLGSIGAVLAAAACPVCFPKLALVGAFFGLGALSAYETAFFFLAQGLVVLALGGSILSSRSHRHRAPLILACASALLFFASLYILPSEWLAYASLAGLIGASILDVVARKRVAAATG